MLIHMIFNYYYIHCGHALDQLKSIGPKGKGCENKKRKWVYDWVNERVHRIDVGCL